MSIQNNLFDGQRRSAPWQPPEEHKTSLEIKLSRLVLCSSGVLNSSHYFTSSYRTFLKCTAAVPL